MVDVKAMEDDVQDHGIVMILDKLGDLRLKLEGASARQEIVELPRRILERELDMVEPRLLERPDARLVESHTGGDEVRVEAELARFGDDDLQVVPHQGLAAG